MRCKRCASSMRLGQRLVNVPKDVVDVLDAHRHANHVGQHPSRALLRIVKLAVGGGGGVDDQGARVADVGQMAHETGRLR